MRVLATLLLALTLAACALPVHKLSSGYHFDGGKDEGVVVVSVRVKNACPVNMSVLTLEGLTAGGASKASLMAMNRFNKNDFENPPGFLHIQKFPAGQWRFAKYTHGHYASRKDIDRLFTVTPGVITYLGELMIDVPSCEGYQINVADERVRDGALFDARMEHLKSRDFQVQIPARPPAAPKR